MGTAVLILGLLPVTAEAHRDGCHRWHSCPSDTGSYVCGDLGYDTYCGGSGGGGLSESLDLTAPEQPRIARPHAVSGGRVRLTVTAEKGSRIEVAETDGFGIAEDTVATATATGGPQTITFKAGDGSHTYAVTATDSADNVSDAADDITVDVDAEAPEIAGFSTTDPDPTSATAAVSFDSEAGAAYALTVSGRKERLTGTIDSGGSVSDAALVLPDGSYTLRLTVTDAAGNARHAERKLRVALGELAPRLTAEQASGADHVRFTVTAPPQSRGSLTLGDTVRRVFTTDSHGLAEVSAELPDGRYPAPVVEVTDRYGRQGRTSGRKLVVDTVAPVLTVRPDSNRAAHGDLSLAVTAEARTRITVAYDADVQDHFTASGQATTVSRAFSPGTYGVTVTATDPYGNVTTKRLSVTVDDRRTAGDWLVLLVQLFLLLGLIVAVLYILRRTRPAREARRTRRAVDQYERDLAGWERERARLVELAEFAAELGQEGSGTGGWLAAWGRRRRDESVWWVTDADMVQPATNGQEIAVRDSGTLVVTDQRLVFMGRTRREWLFAKLEHIEHVGHDTTLMRVSNRANVSGVRYRRETERTRLAVDSAVADAPRGVTPALGTGRGLLLSRLRQGVKAHDRLRPAAPEPSSPVGRHEPAGTGV
ncbi:PKD domain-containing protein [Streptomyces sp. NRRL B-3229]|uniref:PKD domain-containing protein n=1 Tax=Streptomyces sp. NRRL B-3229 TaxID=1463836 RepID=UPI0004C17944|nr:PKD domain-containing protein [Streptomyces sp. NRRL B-3229]